MHHASSRSVPTHPLTLTTEREGVASNAGQFFVDYPIPLLNTSTANNFNPNITSFVFKVQDTSSNGLKFIVSVSVTCSVNL